MWKGGVIFNLRNVLMFLFYFVFAEMPDEFAIFGL
jgi:hypothetical protein